MAPVGEASDAAQILLPPPGATAVPPFEDGWLNTDNSREPFLSYVERDPSVNWSEELEALHEDASRTHFMDRWTREAIIERLGLLPTGATVADVGCSTGFLLEDLARAYPRATLIGIDLVSAGLRKAHRAVPKARLVRADACTLPLRDASIDAVVSANLLEHVPDDCGAVREIARVLRPGAVAVLVVPAGPGTYDYYDRFLGHQRRYARRELASRCIEAGLELIEDNHIAAFLYPAFWAVKQRNRRVHLDLAGAALEARVAVDIGQTNDSRVGELCRRLEIRLTRAGVRFPFGIRSLVAVRRPEVSA
jgi:SAM-dependent methyltransferase